MDRKKQVASSSPSSLDHLFGPKGSSSSPPSSSTGLFGSIFPPPSTVPGREPDFSHRVGDGKYQTPDDISGSKRGESMSSKYKSQNYPNETVEPSYLSSSIYYGGQENYSPRTNKTGDSRHVSKKDGKDDEGPNGSDSTSASRGNWWEGSLYY